MKKLSKNLIGWIIFAIIAVLMVISGAKSFLVQHRIWFSLILAVISVVVVLFFGDWDEVDEHNLDE